MLEEVFLSSQFSRSNGVVFYRKDELQFAILCGGNSTKQNKLKCSKAKINVHSCSVIKFPITCRPKRSSVTDKWEHHNLRQGRIYWCFEDARYFFPHSKKLMVPVCHLVLQLVFQFQLETAFIRITKWLSVAIGENCDTVSPVKTLATQRKPKECHGAAEGAVLFCCWRWSCANGCTWYLWCYRTKLPSLSLKS